MENNEILAKLKELLTKSVNYDRLLEETKIHHSELEKAKKRCPSASRYFESVHPKYSAVQLQLVF